ncbi:hypothetical protein LOTGIDRAFT_228747, partial [Lottia gigantea]
MAEKSDQEKNASPAKDGGSHTIPLEDEDKVTQEGQFVGATLELNDSNKTASDSVTVNFAGPVSDNKSPKQTTTTTNSAAGNQEEGSGFNRNRPGSVIGGRSVQSTSSRTSMRPGCIKSDGETKSYFSYKVAGMNFNIAVDECRKHINDELDGKYIGRWLLSEIDHWNLDKEKLVILTDNSILVFKYNFITQVLFEFKRIMLHGIDTIAIGDFKYPDYSVMPDRKHGGIQIRWNKGQEPTFGQRWNPWSTDIPWLCFAHHPVLYHPKENETTTYNVDDFYESLVQAASKCFEEKRPGENITIVEGPILINSYASVAAVVHNQSGIGFFRDRNGICY